MARPLDFGRIVITTEPCDSPQPKFLHNVIVPRGIVGRVICQSLQRDKYWVQLPKATANFLGVVCYKMGKAHSPGKRSSGCVRVPRKSIRVTRDCIESAKKFHRVFNTLSKGVGAGS